MLTLLVVLCHVGVVRRYQMAVSVDDWLGANVSAFPVNVQVDRRLQPRSLDAAASTRRSLAAMASFCWTACWRSSGWCEERRASMRWV